MREFNKLHYYQGGFYGNRHSKSGQIKEAMERKERGIALYTSAKDVSIAVSAASRDAANYCIHHPDWKSSLSEEERFAWIDNITKKFVSFYAEKHSSYSELYQRIKNRKERIEEKVMSDEEIEMNEELEEDNREEIVKEE